jgi:hypothetical protein
MSYIRIKPKSWQLTAVSLRVHVVSYRLNESADIVAQLCDESGKVIDRHNLTLDGEDFALWSYDDQFVVDWVCEKLNLEIDSEHIQVEHLEEQE